jgi:release factor glutamine methyltransferase
VGSTRPGFTRMIADGGSLSAIVRELAADFTAAGLDTPMLDARLLTLAAAGIEREQIIRDGEQPLGREAARRLADFARRRLAREPVSRIVGKSSFYGRDFIVTPDTLDPRPDTETLIDLTLDLAASEGWHERPVRILDVGTGTGCILLTLLVELGERATGTGIDPSPAALAVARRNGEALGLAERATWLAMRADEPLDGTFDLVVANPPYIPSGEIAGLDPEVRGYDPHPALDGGDDGLDIVRDIIDRSAVQPGVWHVLEHGAGQSDAVLALIGVRCGARTAAGARVIRDLGGHRRCVAWKPLI